MKFYLGTHQVDWLDKAGVPLFVSHRRLKTYKKLPRATTPWALDSGGFTEISMYGEWRTTPQEYVTAVRRYRDEVGLLEWASPQDWMNEPAMLARTGLSIAEHQRLTIENYLALRELAPDLPFVPVLQGWEPDDYLRCVELYDRAGVDLQAEHVVGVGTVCRRQDTETATTIFTSLRGLDLNLHGFGVKVTGLRRYADALASADSMAWSFRARRDASDREAAGLPRTRYGCSHQSCANCMRFALEWRKAIAA